MRMIYRVVNKASLRELSTQNSYAAVYIQRIWRGHRCRKKLWAPDGILRVAAVSKIQRNWRGYLGRKKAIAKYQDYLDTKASVIQGLCRCWKARRIVRMKKAEYINNLVTRLQKSYRGRIGRKYFRNLKEKFRCKMATIIQKCLRGYHSRKQTAALKSIIYQHRARIQEIAATDYTLSKKVHLSIFTQNGNGRGTQRDESAALEECLLHFVASRQTGVSLMLAIGLCRNHPRSISSYIMLVTCLLYSWVAVGKARVVSWSYLEEALGVMHQLSKFHDTFCNEYTAASINLLEKCYFLNNFFVHGINSRSLAQLAAFLQATEYSSFGAVYNVMTIERIKRLLHRSLERSSLKDIEATKLRNTAFTYLFESKNDLLLKKRKIFQDAHLELNTKSSNVVVDFEIFRAGEILLVLGSLADSRIMCPLRPIVLSVEEVTFSHGLAVQFFAHAESKPEFDVQKYPKWKLLADYVLKVVRLVSCGNSVPSGQPNSSSLLATIKFSLPFLDYKRREEIDLKCEVHAARAIQQAYRGFQGRAIWRRLHLHIVEENRQNALQSQKFKSILHLRDFRYHKAQLIQAIARGWLWRRQLRRMNYAAIRIQCCVRCRQARRLVAQERLRAASGPQVIVMLKRSVTISNRKLQVSLYRCGLNFKLVGNDLMEKRQYCGFIYQPEIMSLINRNNKKVFKQSSKIMSWQFERISELLIENVVLVPNIEVVTKDLRQRGLISNLTFVISNPSTQNINLENFHKHRSLPLNDTVNFTTKYRKESNMTVKSSVSSKKLAWNTLGVR